MPSPMPAVTPLADTFGGVIVAPAGAVLPDPAEAMRLFDAYGALVLRGFPFTKESFTAFSDACCAAFSSYVGGGFRFRSLDRESKDATGTVMSTTGSAQSFGLALHGEMYYQAERPDMLWFYCERAPSSKGETTLADGHAIFARLTDASKALLRSHQLLYVRQLSAADWTTTFRTSDVGELRRICAQNAMSVDIAPDGSIRTEYRSPAVQRTADNQEVFINTALLLWETEQAFKAGHLTRLLGDDVKALPLSVRFDDGSPLPDELMDDVAGACEACTFEIAWQKGDVAMVDNRRIMHGRRKAGGDEREILVRLATIDAPRA